MSSSPDLATAAPSLDAPPAEVGGARRRSLVKVLSIVAIVIALFLIMRTLPIAPVVARLESWIDSLGLLGPVIFGAIYVVAAVAFVPGSALTLAAGAIFGLGGGFVTVSIASTTAAAISFLIARYVARDSVRQIANNSPKFNAADRAIGEGGWRIVAMLRLVPMFPFSVGNYLLGLTPIRFWPYVLASWIGMMPGTFVYIYVAHLGRAGVEAATGTGGRSWLEWAMLIVAFAAALGVTVYLTKLVRRKLEEQTELTQTPSETPSGVESSGETSTSSGGAGRVLPLAAVLLLILAACATLRPNWASGLFGPPEVVLAEAYADRQDGAMFDHTIFDEMLKRYVSDDDGGGWVDYAAWARDDRDTLEFYVDSLASAPLDDLSRNELLALLINAYNACTVKLIIEHLHPQDPESGEGSGDPPVEGDDTASAPTDFRSIRDIPSARRWSHQRWRIGGNTWSLDQIEHEQIRPKFREPRIHWAVVCAAVGCPPLRSEAYTGQRIEAQLADQARIVHTHPRWFRLDTEANEVHLTQLYNWYGRDFAQVDGDILEHAANHDADLRDMLAAGTRPYVRWLDYDWDLNTRRTAP